MPTCRRSSSTSWVGGRRQGTGPLHLKPANWARPAEGEFSSVRVSLGTFSKQPIPKVGAAWMPLSGVSVDDQDVAMAVMSDRGWQASLDETLRAAHPSVADHDEIRRDVLCRAKKRLRCIPAWIVDLERNPLGFGVGEQL